MSQQRPSWVAFLDIEGTYDNIDRGRLWHILEGVGITEIGMELLREIYKDNKVQIAWEGIRSRQLINIHICLKQSYPLPPLLFAIYVAEIERRLEGSKLDLDSSHSLGGQVVEQSIRGLFNAEDIVLPAGNAVDLQRLADICAEEATRLSVSFSTVNSGIMGFNGDENSATVSIQQTVLPAVKNYRYLGVTLSERKEYIEDHQ